MASVLFSSIKYADGLTIVGISTCTAAVCEAISWFFIYSTNSYKFPKAGIEKASKKLETMKTNFDNSKYHGRSSRAKKIDRLGTSLKESRHNLSMFKLKSGAVVALVLVVVFAILNRLFDGRPVGRIPFVPIGLVQKMSHRGLPGGDMTDCSMTFLYFLCSMGIRTNLQKYLGFSPARGDAGAGFKR